MTEPKLPLWRLIAGIAVLGAMAVVLISLAPVYVEAYRLRQYVHSVERRENASDDAVRADVVKRAHELDLPVSASDVQITHDAGKAQVHLKYAVQMDFPLFQVDLHP